MKKFAAIVLSLVLTLSLAACGSKTEAPAEQPSEPAAPTEQSSDKILVGFSSAAFADEWCKHLADSFVELTKTDYPQFEAVILDGQIDAEKQTNTIQALIQQGCKYIAAQPMPGLEPALLEVNAAGIPLFCVDMVPTSDELKWTQVGVDEAEFGRLQAEYLAKVLPENGTVCIAMNQLGMNSQIYRTAGFEEKIAELRPDVKILDEQPADSKTDKAMNLTEDWLQRFGEDGVNAIVCQSSMTVQGVVETLRAHNLLGKVYVAAQDFSQPIATEWLKNGETYVDVFYDYTALARGVYDTILAYENGTALPEQVMINPAVFTAENVDTYQG